MHKAYLSIMFALSTGRNVLVTTTSNVVRSAVRVDRNFCYFDDGTWVTMNNIANVDVENK